jgi:hypothetical protein
VTIFNFARFVDPFPQNLLAGTRGPVSLKLPVVSFRGLPKNGENILHFTVLPRNAKIRSLSKTELDRPDN